MHLAGKQVLLSYTINGEPVQESPSLHTWEKQPVVVRSLRTQPHQVTLSSLIGSYTTAAEVRRTPRGMAAICPRRPCLKARNPLYPCYFKPSFHQVHTTMPTTTLDAFAALRTREAYEAGASLVHIHVRNADESSGSDPAKFAEVQAGVRKHCPGMIIQFSTGGRGRGRAHGVPLGLGA